MKVMCMYLPQYHAFRENDEWWGEGYTEWTAVKRARPLYKGHIQPKVPLGGNYYDLSDESGMTWKWQAKLAETYGIYGFSVYQYWFTGKQLMEKPLEILLRHPEIPLRYNICWANETWTRTWYQLENEILMKQEYGGEEEWEMHFSYLLPFFKDERYIKIDGKPVFQIYRTKDIERLAEMTAYFRKRAREEGFSGIFFVSGNTAGALEDREGLMDGYYDFEPGYTLKHDFSSWQRTWYNGTVFLKTLLNKCRRKKILERSIPSDWILNAVERRRYGEKEFPGLIADWDNTPRRDYKGLVYRGTNPKRFGEVLRTLARKVEGREADFVYINAWNEWGEGAVLEPDEVKKYAYLEEVRRVTSERLG